MNKREQECNLTLGKNLPETRPPSLIMSGDTDHLLLSRSLSFISTDDLGVCFCSRPTITGQRWLCEKGQFSERLGLCRGSGYAGVGGSEKIDKHILLSMFCPGVQRHELLYLPFHYCFLRQS